MFGTSDNRINYTSAQFQSRAPCIFMIPKTAACKIHLVNERRIFRRYVSFYRAFRPTVVIYFRLDRWIERADSSCRGSFRGEFFPGKTTLNDCLSRESATVAMDPYALARGVELRVGNPPPLARGPMWMQSAWSTPLLPMHRATCRFPLPMFSLDLNLNLLVRLSPCRFYARFLAGRMNKAKLLPFFIVGRRKNMWIYRIYIFLSQFIRVNLRFSRFWQTVKDCGNRNVNKIFLCKLIKRK